MIAVILIVAVCGVAYTNGANANFKGVASLYGSGTTSRWTATLLGTAATFAGSVTALVVAHYVVSGILKAFGGRDIVPDELAKSQDFLAAVALGGAATSLLANRLGFPVSTTHALVGALVGAGLVGAGTVQFAPLANLILLPLLFSPVVAALLGAVAYLGLRRAGLAPDHRTQSLDACHIATACAASFARGLNDTPKIVAPLLALPELGVGWMFLMVAGAIALGGLTDSRNVAETLGKKVTEMNPGQGFTACLVTAGLVIAASIQAMPVSTTHVSVGSLLGMGAITRRARWRKAGEIGLSWVATVPCGAALAALAYWTVRQF